MPLGLHTRCLSRLSETLQSALTTFRVDQGNFLNRASLEKLVSIENVIPKERALCDKLQCYISETPFFDFVYGQLSKELRETQDYVSDSVGVPLTSIPAYSDASAVARRLVEAFEALPRTYRFTFKLNRSLSALLQAEAMQLSRHWSLVRPNKEFCEEFALQSGIPGRDKWLHGLGLMMLGGPMSKEWDSESAYLQCESAGFIGAWTSTVPEHHAVASLKSILGVGFAIRAFDEEPSYSSRLLRHRAYVHEKVGDKWIIYSSIELDEELSRLITHLKIDELNGTLKTDKAKAAFLGNRMRLLSMALSPGSVNDRLLLAGRWLLDSYVTQNQLLAFVQCAVALEILLGDKAVSDVLGIGELLRNRCAYLIGKSHQQRLDILNDFNEIYKVRSKIVHRGKDRLTGQEMQLFYKLRWMVSRVVQEEVELLEQNA